LSEQKGVVSEQKGVASEQKGVEKRKTPHLRVILVKFKDSFTPCRLPFVSILAPFTKKNNRFAKK
jgi:hypothetical protein